MTKPTPGPWKALHDADGDYAIYAGDKLITVTNSDTTWDEANARLIAAAPELLEACERLLNYKFSANLGDQIGKDVVFALEALKKAKGE